MCGIAGFSDYDGNLLDEKYLWMALVRRMARRLSHRGPDDQGAHVSAHSALAHRRLAVIDPQNGHQPMTTVRDGKECTVVYNGELYNAAELRVDLESRGFTFYTDCDTEVVLNAYLCYGEECPEKLNGIFAFAVDDCAKERTFLCRDRFGVKPLFYTFQNDRLAFSSEIKGLFEYPGVNPVLGRDGLCEIFGLGPARTPGCGVFQGIYELKPGYMAFFDREGFRDQQYFDLTAMPHMEDYESTVTTLRELLMDTVERQMVSDVPLCTFLSGGLDSSVVTAIAARLLKEQGKSLSTYSFEFQGNEEFFTPSSFQPDRDQAWAEKVSELLGTYHTTLLCSNDQLADSLFEGVIAKDLPGMADIDGSLLHFCRQVKKNHVVALCGECADEIFGGYPWFHRREMFDGTHFPWSNNLDVRQSLLKPELAEQLKIENYVNLRLQEALDSVPVLSGESAEQRRMREISYLNMKWFMSTLLDRKDRCSMASGLEVRVPYCDHRIAQYVFNIPWDFKCPGGIPKGLLRDAAKGLLPQEILQRKKSPYPKTHNPGYEQILKQRLSFILRDGLQPIHKILSEEVVQGLLNQNFDYGKPWFGQLMAGPQMLAYLIQINYWMLHYNIYLDI
ncbi:asparagine synthase (glutamine-hydrolyzing) [Acutalibacter sp. 1XD8-33]|uniref:asparagine synthase (glutamine-hydrolyzing) n=1 Tax=Acutalibacter sp. 1XD8-33 TaxID=2320081 RepID=UPI000EA08EB8|nr:asparagine synthase (glutamine-hydrolyzing) [Acutalibacter sp. 1XD8-33]RKJ40339.1 asparagine synthase (glutamine-hydrolyzing) [Acutalibacter sp. 1XD8-33]